MKTIYLIGALILGIKSFAQDFNYLDINNVKALVTNRGDMHCNNHKLYLPSYENPQGSGRHVNSGSCIWIGGKDEADNIHLAAQTLQDGTRDFCVGPLDTITGSVNLNLQSLYDKVWRINKTEIAAFISNFNSGNVQNGSYVPSNDFLTWPAQGQGNNSRNLAPFEDVNHNGKYDPLTGGDYPKIKGDQTLYCIFNDNIYPHSSSHCNNPLKVEIHLTAYAYGNSQVASQYSYLKNTTFYNYKIINRSNHDYHDMYFSMWSFGAIGYENDDYMQCNVKGNFAYTYNGDSIDRDSVTHTGYGSKWPISGYQILKGIPSNTDGIDNNNNGLIDEQCEQQLMTRFNRVITPMSCFGLMAGDAPSSVDEFYNYLSGLWYDGTPITCGGGGYGGTISTNFMFTGNSNLNSPCGSTPWYETSVPGQRRYLLTTGPFLFEKKSTKEIEFAHHTAFDYTTANDPLPKFNVEMEAIKNFSETYNPPLYCSAVSVKEVEQAHEFSVFPNPATNWLKVQMHKEPLYHCQLEIIDVLGKVRATVNYDELTDVEINVSNLSSGVYFIKLNSDGKTSIKKFVKE